MRAPTTITLRIALFVGLAAVSCREVASIDLREAPRLGPEGAPTEIIVFSDFQCGFCKRAAAELERLSHKYPARLEVLFKHFPIEYHGQALNAARAAEAARLQGRFWEMHDLLFANAAELTDEIYVDLAKRIGLDVARFERDFAAPATVARVNADKADGDAIGVDGTPFFVINRQPFYGSYGDLERMID
ncbi:MAG: DsbA family protein [Proteobacteria bacterium]|nr:DsbA family protein [Pseudomonadota bacterium]